MIKFLKVNVLVNATRQDVGLHIKYTYSDDYLDAIRSGRVSTLLYSAVTSPDQTSTYAIATCSEGAVPSCAKEISLEEARSLCVDYINTHNYSLEHSEKLIADAHSNSLNLESHTLDISEIPAHSNSIGNITLSERLT